MRNTEYNKLKMPADNWRFGASGGVARPNVCADFQVSALVRAAVNPRPRQAAPTLAVSGGQRNADNKTENLK